MAGEAEAVAEGEHRFVFAQDLAEDFGGAALAGIVDDLGHQSATEPVTFQVRGDDGGIFGADIIRVGGYAHDPGNVIQRVVIGIHMHGHQRHFPVVIDLAQPGDGVMGQLAHR